MCGRIIVLGHARRRVTGFVAPHEESLPPAVARSRPMLRRMLLGCGLFVLTFVLASALLAALTLLWPGLYPGVRVGGVDLGGADRADAAARVAVAASQWEDTPLTISGPAGTSAIIRQALGFRYDRDATLATALAVGHTGSLPARLGTILELWWRGRDLPVSYTVDEATLTARLGEMAGGTDVQPRDGALRIVDGRAIVTSGDPARDRCRDPGGGAGACRGSARRALDPARRGARSALRSRDDRLLADRAAGGRAGGSADDHG